MPLTSIIPGRALSVSNDSRSRIGLLKSLLSLLFLALFSTAACGITGPGGSEPQGPEEGDVRILFVGSSYLAVNDLPAIFAGMAERSGKRAYVAQRVQSGYYLDFFAQDETTTRAIQDHEWDYVILSGGCQTAAYPSTHHIIKEGWGHHDPFPALKTFESKVSGSNPETVLVYIMPWAFEDGMTWIPGQTDNYFAMQDSIRTHVLAWADSLDLAVSPVGMAWKRILETEVSQHFLHEADWNHPNPGGSYLSAATLFATVFREGVEEVDFPHILSRKL